VFDIAILMFHVSTYLHWCFSISTSVSSFGSFLITPTRENCTDNGLSHISNTDNYTDNGLSLQSDKGEKRKVGSDSKEALCCHQSVKKKGCHLRWKAFFRRSFTGRRFLPLSPETTTRPA
jgi:hypothetical protein